MRVRPTFLLGLLPALRALMLAISVPLAPAAVAQQEQLPLAAQFTVRRWGVEHGFPEGGVTSIRQAPDGFLWMITRRHLFRFDGLNFERVPEGALPTKRPSVLCGLHFDRQGNLWLYGEGGLICRRAGRWAEVPLDFPGTSSDLCVHLVCETPDGSLWAATSIGMFRFDGQGMKPVPVRLAAGRKEPSLITEAVVDGSGCFWLIADNALIRFQNGASETIAWEPEKSSEVLRKVFVDGLNTPWIVTSQPITFQTKVRYQRDGVWTGIDPLRITSLVQGRGGDIWLGSVDGLFRCLNGARELLLINSEEMPWDIQCLWMDSDGSLWAGTTRGLFRIRPRFIRMVGTTAQSQRDPIGVLMPKSPSEMWCGTYGVVALQGVPGAMHRIPQVSTFLLTTIFQAKDGSVWFGTEGSHLWRYGIDGSARQFTNKKTDSRTVYSVLQDRTGRVWAGTSRGAMQLGSNEELVPIPGPPDPISVLAEDDAGQVWAGTRGSGLWCLEKNRFKASLGSPEGLASDSVRVLHPDRDVLWIGTPAGLTRRKASSAKPEVFTFTTEHGLPDSDVRQLVDDGNGNLWLGMRSGIVRVTKADLEQVASGDKPSLDARLFDREDGLEAELSQGEGHPQAARLQDGTLWFATRAGIARIDPAKLPEPVPVRPPHLETVCVNGEPVWRYSDLGADGAQGGAMIFGPGTRNLEFRFAMPACVAPERLRFAKLLEGFETDWSQPDPKSMVLFPFLPSGVYRFRLMAGFIGGQWKQSAHSFSFTIKPHLWETWPFQIIAGTLVVGAGALGGGALVRRRSRRRMKAERLRALERERVLERDKAVEQERIRIARDIHDDLGGGLTQIALISELAHASADLPKVLEAQLDKIFQTAHGLARGLNEIVWAVNPENDNLESFLVYLGQYVDDFLRAADRSFRLEIPTEAPNLPMDSAMRHHLFCGVREALTNGVKYAGPCSIKVSARVQCPCLEIEICDDGCGFDPDAVRPGPGRHHGLANMRRRMEEIGGACELFAAPGRGTRVVFRVELKGSASE